MKILSAIQMHRVDEFTMRNEPISSLALMERAGKSCFDWIRKNTPVGSRFLIVCGSGNNGGDGLVIARLLTEGGIETEVYIIPFTKHSDDFSKNLSAAKKSSVSIREINNEANIFIQEGTIVIDAILGTGISRSAHGIVGHVIDTINKSGNEIISIDLPSGLFADAKSESNVIHAHHTLSFQNPKLAFFFSENEKNIGQVHILEIGLDKNFIEECDSKKYILSQEFINTLIIPRAKFSHKGTFGHSLLICGSMGKIGAAVLSGRGCLRSGTGLLTVHIPACGYTILQTAVPEAMVEVDADVNIITEVSGIDKFDAIGIGPGIGRSEATEKMFIHLLEQYKKPIVIDADALNILSASHENFKLFPENSILTPHPKEFERLVGKSSDDFDRHQMQIDFSQKHKVIVVLKGAHTCITTPDGNVFFNSTGNAGMAKGGSGDVLTGIITALLAQKYQPLEAAIIGVYVHGLAGDFAAIKKGLISMLPSDLIKCLPKAFKRLYNSRLNKT